MNFYILNKEDTIVSVLSSEIVVEKSAPLLKAQLTEKLNEVHKLELITVADSDLTADILEDYTIIFKDTNSNWKEFIIAEVVDSESEYLPEKTITALYSANELKDDLLLSEYSYNTPAENLSSMLSGTRWQLGTVETGIYSRKFTEETVNGSVLSGLFAVAEFYNCDLYFHYTVSDKKVVNRYVSLYKQLGSDSGKRFEIDKDITEIKRTVDTTELKTAIYPLGKEVEDSRGNKSRIDISGVTWTTAAGNPANKPKGQKYLIDETARLQWGRRNTDGSIRNRFVFIEMDIESAEELASMAWVQLGRYTQPKVTYEAKVIDLYRITQDSQLKHEQVYLGDTVAVIDRNFSNPIEIKDRVVELQRDLLLPENDSVVIGTSKGSYSADVNRFNELSNRVDNVITVIDSIASANGKNRTYYGTVEPDHSILAIGDSWVRPHPENPEETQWLVWNGTDWDILIDSTENTVIKDAITQLETESKQQQIAIDDSLKKAEEARTEAFNSSAIAKQAEKDAINAVTEAGNAKTSADKALADAQTALDNADSAFSKANSSEKLAAEAKQDAVNAIAKGDANATAISKTDTELKATVTKVEGNTADISQLIIDNGKISTTVGKVEADLAGLNFPFVNLLVESDNFLKSAIGDYGLKPYRSGESIGEVYLEKGVTYTLTSMCKAGEGTRNRLYVQYPNTWAYSIYTETNSTSLEIISLTFEVPEKDRNGTIIDFTKPFQINHHDMSKLGGCEVLWTTLHKGTTPLSEWTPSISDYTKMSEFSSFVQTSQGFQSTVNNEISGIKSEQTQMAGKITSTVDKVEKLDNTVTQQGTSIVQLSDSITSKADKTELDKTNSTVKTQGTEIRQNSDAIQVKADKTEVNTLKGTVDSQQLQINANANGLIVKADKTELDKTNSTVKNQGSQLSVLDSGLKATNSKVEGNTAQLASLQIQSDKISTSVSKVETDLNGLQIPYSNLLVQSNNHIISKVGDFGLPAFKTGKTEREVYLEKGVTYTVTSLCKAGKGTPLRIYLQYPTTWGYSIFSETLSTEYTILQLTFTVPEKDRNGTVIDFEKPFLLNHHDINKLGGCEVLWTTLHKGEKPLKDWTPSALDFPTMTDFSTFEQTVQGFQTTVNSDISGLQSQQTQMAGQLTTTVEKIENLSVSGRNLLLRSRKSSDVVKIGSNNGGIYPMSIIDVNSGGVEYQRIKRVDIGNGNNSFTLYSVIPFANLSKEKGWLKDVVVSFKARASKSVVFKLWAESYSPQDTKISPDNFSDIEITPEWQTFYARFPVLTGDSGMRVNPYYPKYEIEDVFNFWLDIAEYKIEENASIPSDWSPAPEDLATKTQITQLTDQINLRVEKANVIAQINLSPEAVLIQAKRIHLSGESLIDNAIIKSAMIADGQITDAKIQNATITSAKILSLDVDKLTGNTSNFVQSSWNSITTGVDITGEGIQFSENGIKTSTINGNGQNFWYGSRLLGKTGHTSLAESPDVRGIGHQLSGEGDYISWSYRRGTTGNFTPMMVLDPYGKFYNEGGPSLQIVASTTCRQRLTVHQGIESQGSIMAASTNGFPTLEMRAVSGTGSQIICRDSASGSIISNMIFSSNGEVRVSNKSGSGYKVLN